MIDDEQLIDLVRSNEILYNKFCLGYRMPAKKQDIWRNIANQLGATEEQCTRRWTTLRERYARECKRYDAPSGSAASSAESFFSIYKFMFLKRTCEAKSDALHLQHNGRLALLPIGTIANDRILFIINGYVFAPSPMIERFSSSADICSTEPATPTSSVRAKKRRGNSSFNVDEEFREACSSFKIMCKERSAEKNVAVHAFVQMVVATICDMSSRKQAKAIKQMTDLLMTIKESDED